jgi:hypothetical protein
VQKGFQQTKKHTNCNLLSVSLFIVPIYCLELWPPRITYSWRRTMKSSTSSVLSILTPLRKRTQMPRTQRQAFNKTSVYPTWSSSSATWTSHQAKGSGANFTPRTNNTASYILSSYKALFNCTKFTPGSSCCCCFHLKPPGPRWALNVSPFNDWPGYQV